MREIIFRFWCEKEKRYRNQEELKDNSLDYCFNNDYYIPEQYTGLKDKNGKPIFEGDIVKWIDSDGQTRQDTVKYVKTGFVICNNNYHLGFYDVDSFEIIGNIHDENV